MNRIILGSRPEETVVKAALVDEVLLPQGEEAVGMFELPVGRSRVDACSVGERSAAYEIKTELDTFARLEGQLLDYLDVFEAVYIVVPEARLGELPGYLPDGCGVLSYRQRPRGTYGLELRRAASACSPLDPAKQLAAMDKRGICSSFDMDGDGVPRSELERRCLRSFGAEEIGRGFKRYLLRRYGPRWERFRELQPDIFEIDYQWFYRHGLRPKAVY